MKQTEITTKPQFLLSSPVCGSGKTTLAMGLMSVLSRQGMRVQPFKCSPDYIDTKYHTYMTKRHSINLDTFLATDQHIYDLYTDYSASAHVCIVEGNTGMYDGYLQDQGSTAHVARLLDLPVILVINARNMAYSVVPLLYGYVHFDEKVRIAGVIFNKVRSDRHKQMLLDACQEVGVECFGCLPYSEDLEFKYRRRGLNYSQRNGDFMHYKKRLMRTVGENIRIDRILETTAVPQKDAGEREKLHVKNTSRKMNIAVALGEESFSFVFAEHLKKLKSMGTVKYFLPETSTSLPFDKVDLLYLPGGYPENNCFSLENNTRMRRVIADYIESGGKTLAECGGMIYLSKAIQTGQGMYEMAGILPHVISAREQDKKMTMGYRRFDYNGIHIRGHEYHYTQVLPQKEPLPSVAQMYNSHNEPVPTPIYRYKNLIASYAHLYWGELDIMDLWK